MTNNNKSPPTYNKKYKNHPITPDISKRSHHSQSNKRNSIKTDKNEKIIIINSHSSVLNNSNKFRNKNIPNSKIQNNNNTSKPSIQNSKNYLTRLDIKPIHTQIKTQNIIQSIKNIHQFTKKKNKKNIKYNNNSNTNIVISNNNNNLKFHEPIKIQQHIKSLSNIINNKKKYNNSYN